MAKKPTPETTAVPALVPSEIADASAAKVLAGYKFQVADIPTYIGNIRELARRTADMQREAVCATVLLGRYCRDVGHELKSKGKGEFGAWLKAELPDIPYSAIATAMRVAGDLSQKHPELRHIDTEEKVEQLTMLIDGRSLTAFGRALHDDAPNGDKRPHHPSTKSAVEKADDTKAQRRLNMLAAVKGVGVEIKHGNAGALSDEDIDEVLGALADYTTQIREIRDARKSGTKPPKKRADVGDL